MPMIARVDGLQIDNRKEICRRFLRQHGWTDEMFKPVITNQLERCINKVLNGGEPRPGKHYSIAYQPKSKRRHRSKNPNIPEPSREEASYWLAKWNELEDYVAQEKAIDRLFLGEFGPNDNLQNILIKCSVLNDFYSTNIFKIYPVAKHILELGIDARLSEGDPTIVDEIAANEIGGTIKNFYSFASKYCSHHKPLDYPIYDSYVDKVLTYYRDVDEFADFGNADLKIYSKFKNILVKFREFYGLEEFNLKQLDQYLWQFGKRYFPKKYY